VRFSTLIVRSLRYGALLTVLFGLALSPRSVGAQEPAGQSFALDMVVDDPDRVCDRIEATREAVIGEEFLVGICLVNAPEPPAVVTFTVLYDDRVVIAPNVGECDGDFDEGDTVFSTPVPGAVASVEEALDCNPDANVGRTTFGPSSLGENWDCTSGGVVEPWGNRQPPTGNSFNGGCISAAGPYTLAPTAAVAMMTFRAESPGETALTPVRVQITGASGVATGTCLPVLDVAMACQGGVLTVEGAATDDSPAAGAGSDGSSFPWRAAVFVGCGALVLLGIVLWFSPWRRRPPGEAS
jgi:hypothetical protein